MQVKFIAEQDLRVIDALWRASSDGKFGYSAQKELWVQNRRYWERLFKVIDWTHGEHNFYRCRLNLHTLYFSTGITSGCCPHVLVSCFQ